MKRSYTLRLFLVALGLFWLSLLLITNTRTSSRYSDEIQLPYTQLAGIEQLELARIHADKEYSSNIEIHYVDQPHITVEFRGISDPAVVKNLFVRNGNRLILQPEVYTKDDSAAASNPPSAAAYQDGWWRIAQINLPLQITQLRAHNIRLTIGKDEEAKKLTLPTLNIEAQNADIEFWGMDIGTLNVRNAEDDTSYTEKSSDANNSGTVTIDRSTTVGQLFIESINGHIKLANTAAIQHMRLHTTPETSIELDRIDAFQRIHWTPLPALEMPQACHTTPAETPASAAASAVAAASAK